MSNEVLTGSAGPDAPQKPNGLEKWETRVKERHDADMAVLDAQIEELVDVKLHRRTIEARMLESNEIYARNSSLLVRAIEADERQAAALERIAESLGKPPLTFVPIRNEP